ncbi:peptidylprolyl isomerase [Spongiimicrobium salis]|uniref:peptidylprolyl isomerase n=1 Tax=Spongiimicrobium salis TaxID=1667022 RepID=UPI00374CFCB7
MKKLFAASLLLLFALTSCNTGKRTDLPDGIYGSIKTNKGDILVQLTYEQTPITVANFVSLAEGNSPFVSDSLKGKKYFDGLIFHRVIKDWMIQGGDPTGTGTGTPGYSFKNEIVDTLRHSKGGILSMANTGRPKSNGSQFFITHTAKPLWDGKHSVFGEVIEGMEVVNVIANVETQVPKNRPLEDIVMNSVEILRIGTDAEAFDAIKIMGDYFKEEEELLAKIEERRLAFVAELAEQKKLAQEQSSGLKIYTLKKGEGAKPTSAQRVLVNYSGWLDDGKPTLFASTEQKIAEEASSYTASIRQSGRFAPSAMPFSTDSNLTAGFKEGLLSMRVGDKLRLFIPPHLGWGEQGVGGAIPPNADIIFDIEILDIAE